MSWNSTSNTNIPFDCTYHVVFCSNNRKPVLKDAVSKRLEELLRTIAEEEEVFLEIEIMPDHVHLLLSCDPSFYIPLAVKQFKEVSSNDLRKKFPHLKSALPSLWTNSYFVAETGEVNLEVIKEYIENQESS